MDKITRGEQPEFNMAPSSPYVTWAEASLAHAVVDALNAIELLEKRIIALEAELGAAGVREEPHMHSHPRNGNF